MLADEMPLKLVVTVQSGGFNASSQFSDGTRGGAAFRGGAASRGGASLRGGTASRGGATSYGGAALRGGAAGVASSDPDAASALCVPKPMQTSNRLRVRVNKRWENLP
eukprot:TRINITY_DN14858_c0_g1_i2.p2 TRINITY_DN14858_c0_g1~~TRINITY_DN14858_c0_g1_i2.p2  ORF type:complete len:108 (-),score=13.07 TRINITY_DN14858_c0_g1_i2:371-694(-)